MALSEDTPDLRHKRAPRVLPRADGGAVQLKPKLEFGSLSRLKLPNRELKPAWNALSGNTRLNTVCLFPSLGVGIVD